MPQTFDRLGFVHAQQSFLRAVHEQTAGVQLLHLQFRRPCAAEVTGGRLQADVRACTGWNEG